MAQKQTVTLIDDIDGESIAAETVRFGLDGVAYEIDLTEANAALLRGAFAAYVAAARKTPRGPVRGARKPVGAVGPTADEIRSWAKSKKLAVSERGRISAELQAAYAAAH